MKIRKAITWGIVKQLVITVFACWFFFKPGLALSGVGDNACNSIVFQEMPGENKLSVFSVSTVCQKKYINQKELVHRYQSNVNKMERYNILSENVDPDGVRYVVKESVKTSHGNMVIDGDITLMNLAGSGFSYLHTSKKISATGAAAFTKHVQEMLNISKNDKGYEVVVSKVLRIKKPWYAPKAIFKKEVKKGLIKDMKEIVDRHLQVISAN